MCEVSISMALPINQHRKLQRSAEPLPQGPFPAPSLQQQSSRARADDVRSYDEGHGEQRDGSPDHERNSQGMEDSGGEDAGAEVPPISRSLTMKSPFRGLSSPLINRSYSATGSGVATRAKLGIRLADSPDRATRQNPQGSSPPVGRSLSATGLPVAALCTRTRFGVKASPERTRRAGGTGTLAPPGMPQAFPSPDRTSFATPPLGRAPSREPSPLRDNARRAVAAAIAADASRFQHTPPRAPPQRQLSNGVAGMHAIGPSRAQSSPMRSVPRLPLTNLGVKHTTVGRTGSSGRWSYDSVGRDSHSRNVSMPEQEVFAEELYPESAEEPSPAAPACGGSEAETVAEDASAMDQAVPADWGKHQPATWTIRRGAQPVPRLRQPGGGAMSAGFLRQASLPVQMAEVAGEGVDEHDEDDSEDWGEPICRAHTIRSHGSPAVNRSRSRPSPPQLAHGGAVARGVPLAAAVSKSDKRMLQTLQPVIGDRATRATCQMTSNRDFRSTATMCGAKSMGMRARSMSGPEDWGKHEQGTWTVKRRDPTPPPLHRAA